MKADNFARLLLVFSLAIAANGTVMVLARDNAELAAAAQAMVEGHYDEAAQAFQRALDSDPNNVEALAGLGMALGRQNKLDDADQAFDKVLQVAPNHAVAHCGKAMVLLSRVQLNQLKGSKSDALRQAGRECNKALDADPRVVEAHYLLGKVWKEEGRLDRAVQAFNGAIKLDPHYANAYASLAAVQFLQGNYAEAIESYKQVLGIAPKSSAAHIGLGEVYLKQSRPVEAIQELTAAMAANPNNATAHLFMARALEQRGNSEGAMKEYQEAVRLKPDLSEAYTALAELQENKGEYGTAADLLRTAVRYRQDDVGLRLHLAADYLRSRRLEEAEREFHQVLTLAPSEGAAATGLARVYAQKVVQQSAPVVTSSAEFQAASRDIAQAARGPRTNLTLRLADAEMRALSGQPVELSSLPAPESDAERLAFAEVFLAQRKFPEASGLFLKTINNTYQGRGLCEIADLALFLGDPDSAEIAYRRANTFMDVSARAQHGLSMVSEAREEAVSANHAAQRLLAAKQLAPAIEKFRAAIQANPKLADPHLGLADALERFAATAGATNPGGNLHESISEYRLYLSLASNIFPRDVEKVQRRIERLESVIVRAQKDPNPGWRGLLQRLTFR